MQKKMKNAKMKNANELHLKNWNENSKLEIKMEWKCTSLLLDSSSIWNQLNQLLSIALWEWIIFKFKLMLHPWCFMPDAFGMTIFYQFINSFYDKCMMTSLMSVLLSCHVCIWIEYSKLRFAFMFCFSNFVKLFNFVLCTFR